MPMKRISSSPFIRKRVFPVAWFGFLAVVMISTLFTSSANKTLPLPFLIVPLLMAVFGYWLLKKLVFDLADEVSDEGDDLLVRFGNVQEKIVLANIINVSYTVMANPRVTLTLREPCRFGKELFFLPPTRWVPFSKNPVITELIERIDAARRQIRAGRQRIVN